MAGSRDDRVPERRLRKLTGRRPAHGTWKNHVRFDGVAEMADQIDYDSVITVPDRGIGSPPREIAADERIESVLIPEDCLQARVKALATQICRDYATTKELHMVVVLNGAFVFSADLGREIYKLGGPDIKYDFLKAVTYGTGIKGLKETERQVSITFKPAGLERAETLLVDDIVDQAFTLSKVRHLLEIDKASSIRTCALLSKILRQPSPHVRNLKEQTPLDYVGFNVPDRWVAGYGIDAGEDFRHLPFIVAVNEDYYRKGTI